MFDFEKWSKEQTDKIFLYFNLDTDKIYSSRFKKFIKFMGYKLNPFILSVASFIILVYILNRISDSAGFEKAVIVGIVIIVFVLRGISGNINKLTE